MLIIRNVLRVCLACMISSACTVGDICPTDGYSDASGDDVLDGGDQAMGEDGDSSAGGDQATDGDSEAVDEVDILRQRLKVYYLDKRNANSTLTYLSSQEPDGHWTDVNYDNQDQASWAPMTHLYRLVSMAVAYANEAHSNYLDPDLLAGIESGLNYWYTRKPYSTNWWYNEIGQQLQLMPVLVLTADDLPPPVVETGIGYLVIPERYETETGANKAWFSSIIIHNGVLSNNLDNIITGMRGLGVTLAIVDSGEGGIFPDYSFQQHWYLLYNWGYGLSNFSDVSRWSYLTRNLSFGFTQDEANTLADFVLDGTQWMLFKAGADFSASGRELSRPGVINASRILEGLSYMEQLQDDHLQQYRDMINHIEGGSNPLIGNKFFWCADYVTHRRADYFVSVRMFSVRTQGTELVNSENIKGYYLPHGSTTIMTTGNEYINIFPVWDWSRIPGVTSLHKATQPSIPGGYSYRGKTSFVGAATDSNYAAVVFDLDQDDVTAKKAWFFFDEEVVALGAAIKSDASEEVYTSVNQSFLNGAVQVSYDAQNINTIDRGEHSLQAPLWVLHDNVGYVFLNGQDITLKNEQQSGTWYAINNSCSTDTVNEDVFSIWYNHGTQPTSASYAYAIVPSTTASELNELVNNMPLQILANTAALQAVRHATLGFIGTIFHEPGTLTTSQGTTLTADKPCALVLDENGVITVANPNAEAGIITITHNGNAVAFDIPEGNNAGKSITKPVGI
jgi:chondroitin AC lyase